MHDLNMPRQFWTTTESQDIMESQPCTEAPDMEKSMVCKEKNYEKKQEAAIRAAVYLFHPLAGRDLWAQ